MAKITWAGQSCFQISVSNGKDHSADIVIDPFDEKLGLKVPSFSADILLVTHQHYDHNNKGKERGLNTIYTIEAEDMRLCHLGDFGQQQLTDEQLELIGKVDILMIPVGGTFTINSSEAAKVIGQIEPK